MASFKDKNGQSWEIPFAFGDLLRVKKSSDGKYDLLHEAKDLQSRLWANQEELYEVLCYLCEPQVKSRGMTCEQFGEAVGASAIVDARAKFFEEWIDFFRQLQREEVATVLERTVELQKMAAKEAAVKAKEMMGEMFEEKAKAKVKEAISLAFGNWADTWDSTLDHLPGENSN